MEFQAYPTAAPAGRKGVNWLLKVQGALHSTDSVVLPATMLLIASSLMAHQLHSDASRTSVGSFLLKILISMVPLAILEYRVPRCTDPVGLFANFSTKVMIMHLGFLALRWSGAWLGVTVDGYWFCTVMLLAACVLLPTVFGFRPTPTPLRENLDVILLMLAAVGVAFVEVWMFTPYAWNKYSRLRIIEDFICTSSDYIEITAFVPAVWMAYRKGKDAPERKAADVSPSQKRALCLFAFMTVFYSVEDASSAVALWGLGRRIAASGYMIHYLLLLDFAGFLLAQLCDPAKLQAIRGSFMNWLTDACAV